MPGETHTIATAAAVELAAHFDAGRSDILSQYEAFLARDGNDRQAWEDDIEKRKASGEIPRTETSRHYEAGQYLGDRTDRHATDFGGYTYDVRYFNGTLQRARRNRIDRQTRVVIYDIPRRPVSRRHLAFGQYLPWDWYTERTELLQTFITPPE